MPNRVLLIVGGLFAGALCSASTTPLFAAEPPPGFVSLIDAESLAGWKGSTTDWRVEEGVLVGRADGTLKANRFITADIEPVRNFELQVDVWVSSGGNSGLQYRSRLRPDLTPFAVAGYQCDVVANVPQYNGMLYEEKGRRILAHTGEKVVIDAHGQPWVVDKFPVKEFPAGTWHRYRVLVEGNHHRHWIDDVPTVDVVDLDKEQRALEGLLGVQVHVGPRMEIRYRNFFLKRLPDDLPLQTAADAPVGKDAVKVVPQGGWKSVPVKPTDLGQTPNVHRCDDIFLAGQPGEEDLARLQEAGITKVINLRTDAEMTWDEANRLETIGIDLLSLPFRDPDDLTDQIFGAAREALRAAAGDAKVLLHCASANRVAAVWLTHRVLDQNVPLPQAQREAVKVGLRSEAYREKALDYIRHQRQDKP
jgi:protein tyrosine phosphatase (PTP) superfamily phosphohydrolase (DUF442 family)